MLSMHPFDPTAKQKVVVETSTLLEIYSLVHVTGTLFLAKRSKVEVIWAS